jgi:hypothetical protein
MNNLHLSASVCRHGPFASLGLLLLALPALGAEPTSGPPSEWLSKVNAGIVSAEYQFRSGCRSGSLGRSDSWCATNRARNLRIGIADDGIALSPRNSTPEPFSAEISFPAYQDPTAPMMREEEGTVVVEGGGWRAQFRNDPRGFEMRVRVSSATVPTLEVPLRLETDALPIVDETGGSLLLRGFDGSPLLRLAPLLARDFAGRLLPVRIEVRCDEKSGAVLLVFVVTDVRMDGAVEVSGLFTNASWIGDAVQTDSGYGTAVATVGDIDDDGYSDFAVGIPSWDGGEVDEGAVWIYRGGPSGPAFAPTWARELNQAGALFGTSVAPAGDVDGDGYSDLLVGAPGWSSDISEAGEGRVVVYRGGAGGLEVTPAWSHELNQAGASLGSAVATAGDMDGDGDDEIIVGAPLFDAGYIDEGRALLFLGSGAGLATTPALTLDGGAAGARLGSTVALAGDVDADGYSDLLVAAEGWSNGQVDEGLVQLFRGSASGPVTTPAWSREGDFDGARLGSSVAGVGDVDGDGFADVLLGAKGFTNDPAGQAGEGWVFLHRGSASGLVSTAAWSAESDQAEAAFGSSVATAGDVNGDGFADVAIGAPLFDASSADVGRVFVWFGGGAGLGANGLPTNADVVLDGSMPTSHFGESVGTAGDVDGDGLGDLLVGAPLDWIADVREGLAYLFRGGGDGIAASAAWLLESNRASSYFGEYLAAVGDLNGDGYGDVAVGSPQWDNGESNEGSVSVFFGSANGLSTTADWTAESNQASAWFGVSVAAAGDVNGDGYADLAVGAYSWEDNSAVYIDEGKVFVWYGSATGLGPSGVPGNADWIAKGNQSNCFFGWPIVSSDFNGDGFGDIAIGASGYTSPSTSEGGAFVYHGSPTGPGTLPAWWTESNQGSARLGTGLASGDFNGDGYGDLVVGAPLFDNGQSDEGKAWLYPGGPMGLSYSAAWSWEPNAAYTEFGNTLSSGGDLNGDGLTDLVVASQEYGVNPIFNEGKAWAFLGSATTGLASSPVWSYSSGQAESFFGRTLSSVSDFDGDGYSDLLVGAPEYDNGQTNEGRVYLFSGSASGPSSAPTRIFEPNIASCWFGVSVCGGADINGDGWDDLLVGSYTWTNGQTNEGRALLYYGSSGDGLDRIPTQWRADGSGPLELWDRSDSRETFRIRSRGRSAAGRIPIRQEWEAKSAGGKLDGTGISRSPLFTDSGAPVAGTGSAVTLEDTVGGLMTSSAYHWRARTETRSPYFPVTRWLSPQRNHRNETDLRAYAESDVSITLADSPDPVLRGGALVYDMVVTNGGPDADAGVELRFLPPLWLTFVSATTSQGSCSKIGAFVFCRVGSLLAGASANVSLSFSLTSFGSATSSVTATTNSRDLDSSDNAASTTTTVLNPAIGNRVWRDSDRDGIQDAGEPGLAGVTVILYNASGAPTAVTATDASGSYTFTNLTYGATYSVRFSPPAGYVPSPRDQGGNDAIDSDADPFTHQTPPFALTSGLTVTDLDAGMEAGCTSPDEPVYLYSVVRDGNGNPELHFADPNQPSAVTGYNVYRSSQPNGSWTLFASDVVDLYSAVPNIQWVDFSGDPGDWYYDVAAWSSLCSAEGPR